MARRVKLPPQVMARVRALIEAPRPLPPPPPEPAKLKKPLTREKVVAALRKLHPMD